MLLYIHGFNSSPFSDKAVMTAKYMALHHPSVAFHQPQLPNTPKAAMVLLTAYVEAAIDANEPLTYIGSSLGGYFASYLAETYGGKAVLVNPAVKPFELFDEFMGPQFNPYTEQHYLVLPEHKSEVAEFNTAVIRNPDRFWYYCRQVMMCWIIAKRSISIITVNCELKRVVITALLVMSRICKL